MNCQEVELLITDIARGGEASEGALAHITACPACAERFAAEEEMTAGLRALAAVSSGEKASPRVEANLLAAFRTRTTPTPAAGSHRRKLVAAAALAGSIAAGFMVWVAQSPTRSVPTPVATVAAVVAPPVAAAPVAAPIAPMPQPKLRRARRVARPVREPAPAAAERENARIDFLPIPQGDGWTPRDGGRLVRVGLPRSALREFGLPMNEARAQEQVQADVMLSNDGLMRAIRFVP
jgi:hypothetical protein